MINLSNKGTIVLTGGGTAGHVLPHFAVLPHLKKHFEKVIYIGSIDGMERGIVEKSMTQKPALIDCYHGITTVKLRRSLTLRNFAIPYKLIKGINEAKKLLKAIKPDVVFSKGGFVAFPVVRAAAKLGIPVVAHESDLSMGLANKMSVKHANKVCTTFKETAKQGNEKFVFTGALIRPQILSVSKSVKEPKGRRNLLVLGGSLGAAAVNNAVRGVIDKLGDYDIVHICGKGKTDPTIVRKGYTQLEYVDDIEKHLAGADVVISRAGSGSLCELVFLQKPTVFIPLSTGRGDQIENAELVSKANAGIVLHEAELTAETLEQAVTDAYQNREIYSSNCKNVGVINGVQPLVNTICGVLR